MNNKLFTEKGRKFKFSTQGQNGAPFVGNLTKIKIPSEIKPPLAEPKVTFPLGKQFNAAIVFSFVLKKWLGLNYLLATEK